MDSSDLLQRLAATLRSEIGPAIEAEYPRTQAYLAAVVLRKLAGQLRRQDEHAAQAARDRQALCRDLARLLASNPAPPALRAALDALEGDGEAGLCRFIDALYAARDAIGDAAFETLRRRLRQDLRRALDRRLEYAA